MTVYRLEPIPENADSPDWHRRTKWSGTCWVAAQNENVARLNVELATDKIAEGLPAARSPWAQKQLTTCIEDKGKQVAEGLVLLSNDSTIPIPNH